jgi:hypothetical protein
MAPTQVRVTHMTDKLEIDRCIMTCACVACVELRATLFCRDRHRMPTSWVPCEDCRTVVVSAEWLAEALLTEPPTNGRGPVAPKTPPGEPGSPNRVTP